MKTLLVVITLLVSVTLSAQTDLKADSLRLRQLYGESETFDAAFEQIKRIGTDAPYLNLVSADGKVFSNDDLTGKVILVHFWFLTCGGCIIENPILNRIADTLKNEDDFQLIAFANNTNEELQHFLQSDSLFFGKRWSTIKHHPVLKFPVFADPDEEMFNKFNSWSYPGNIIIDRNGIIRKVIYRHELDMSEDEFFEYLMAQIREML